MLPLTVTGFVAARLTASPFTVTAKSVPAGREPAAASRAPSKVMVSAEPLTAAEEKAGGVWFVAVSGPKAATSLPDRSLSRFAASDARVYHTLTDWSCRAAVPNVAVAVEPDTETPVEVSALAPPRLTRNAVGDGVTSSSSRSLKTTVSSVPLIPARTKLGGVVWPVPLNTGWSEKSCTSGPAP